MLRSLILLDTPTSMQPHDVHIFTPDGKLKMQRGSTPLSICAEGEKADKLQLSTAFDPETAMNLAHILSLAAGFSTNELSEDPSSGDLRFELVGPKKKSSFFQLGDGITINRLAGMLSFTRGTIPLKFRAPLTGDGRTIEVATLKIAAQRPGAPMTEPRLTVPMAAIVAEIIAMACGLPLNSDGPGCGSFSKFRLYEYEHMHARPANAAPPA